MVELTQINDESQQNAFGEKIEEQFEEQQANDGDFYDTDSDVSGDELDDEYDIQNESLTDRIVALKDVIPPQQRAQLNQLSSSLYSLATGTLNLGGNFLWTVTTSALLLGVPLSLSIISEQQLVEMENEMKASQSTNDVLAPGAQSGFAAAPAAPVVA
ncbi:mitochondrial import translocase, subunit Tom22 [Nadsonia fulvescens var. elongata DSM 6958]|uniref:Mitochondrial import translocase, subunit Tom22 n=1 Tax=Nadsonia fulvescens var. elongata DSM 6958 TaxID=857566 RepID=A0A1E3PNB0_9ASCO|nr:mitochondrial import translocase, subunit Tom22 [Nadsonia fulvescens var. elongata DSM 6958]